jgi:all-trans-retinol dehydrogenase (NAD+)
MLLRRVVRHPAASTVILSEVLKGLVPIGVRDFIADNIIGVYHTMEDFKGRTEQAVTELLGST